jgi:hypothetical protein
LFTHVCGLSFAVKKSSPSISGSSGLWHSKSVST